MALFTTTVKAVFDALNKNGFEHLRGSWFREEEDSTGKIVVVGGCVLGQSAINLGADQPVSDDGEDHENTLLNQLNSFAPVRGKWMENDGMFGGVGEQIIHWNDKCHYANPYETTPAKKLVYDLATWDEVVEMARD